MLHILSDLFLKDFLEKELNDNNRILCNFYGFNPNTTMIYLDKNGDPELRLLDTDDIWIPLISLRNVPKQVIKMLSDLFKKANECIITQNASSCEEAFSISHAFFQSKNVNAQSALVSKDFRYLENLEKLMNPNWITKVDWLNDDKILFLPESEFLGQLFITNDNQKIGAALVPSQCIGVQIIC